MRKLFEIDESEKRRILEMHINASKRHYLIEQVTEPTDMSSLTGTPQTINSGNATNDWEVGENLEKDINKIIQSVQNETYKQLTIKYVSGPYPPDNMEDSFVFSVLLNGEKTTDDLNLKYEEIYNTKSLSYSELYHSFYTEITFGDEPLNKYLKPIYDNPDYVNLFKKYPEVRKFVRNLRVNYSILPYTGDYIEIGGPIRTGVGDYDVNKEIPFGDKLTTTESGSAIYKVYLRKDKYFDLSVSNAKMQLSEIKIPNPGVKPSEVDTTPKPRDRFVPRSVGGNTGEPFNFNSTILASDGEKQLQKFVDQFLIIKRTDPDLYNTYIDYLNKYYGEDGKINVYAYSSIDDDPNQTITYVEGSGGNAVDKCGGKQLRKEYNKCLSDRRAEVIAAELNKQLPDFPDFIGIGKGESKSVNGVGWTKESPTTEAQTLPNRRFEVELPEYSDVKSAN